MLRSMMEYMSGGENSSCFVVVVFCVWVQAEHIRFLGIVRLDVNAKKVTVSVLY